MNSCLFCDIVNKKKAGYILFEDNNTMVLLDIFPSVAGHSMVIPKKHGITILDFNTRELGEIWTTVNKTIKALQKTYKTDKFTIGINHGERFGVPHLHIHIIPRFEGDGGGIIQTIVKSEIKESLKEVAEKIKENF